MQISRILVSSSLSLLTSAQSYSLEDDYSISNFANMFQWFTGNDPTDGYVNYIDYSSAESSGLYSANGSQVYMAADSTNIATGRGRNSIRLASTKTYNHGLIILDLQHMPWGCGTWPAFWLLGPDWPTYGELDIIEGVNSASTNSFTAHTDSGCSITNTGGFSGTIATSNCDVNAPNQATNAGCSIDTSNTQTYGNGFNGNGGGVFATQWTSQAISIYFFPRGAIPNDISSGNPNPENWGLPYAQFQGGCNIDEHFQNQQIMFDLTFCGSWAGAVWSSDSTCAPKASSCQAFVQNNPSAFTDAYWLINSLKVYQQNGAAATTPATTAATSSTSSFSQPTTTFVSSSTSFSPSFTTPATTFSTFTFTSASTTFSTFTSSSFSPSFTSTPTTFSTLSFTTPSFSSTPTTSLTTPPPFTSQSFSTTQSNAMPSAPTPTTSWNGWPGSSGGNGGGGWGNGGGNGWGQGGGPGGW